MNYNKLSNRHLVNLDEETYQQVKQLAGDVPVARYLKRVIQKLVEEKLRQEFGK